MFGFKARAQARAEQEAAFSRAVHEQLSAFVAAALGEYGGREPFASCAYDIQLGLDAVLLKDMDAWSNDMKAAGDDVFSGAMIAHGARNFAYVTGRVEKKFLEDIRFRMSKHAAQA